MTSSIFHVANRCKIVLDASNDAQELHMKKKKNKMEHRVTSKAQVRFPNELASLRCKSARVQRRK